MATKYNYYAIDPKSSSILVLNDSTGTPNTQVLSCTEQAVHEHVTRSFVGCNTAFTYLRDRAEVRLRILLQIRTVSMSELYDKMAELKLALHGDARIPGGNRRFDFIMAYDGSTYYGFENCTLVRFNPNWRPQMRIGAVDYPPKKEPYFTITKIMIQTAYSNMVEL